jgi:glycosyltransferase 2 family protein
MERVALPEGWVGGVAALVGVAVVIYLGLLVWSGAAQSLESIKQLGVWTAALGTTVASLAYLVRFVRWQAVLSWLGHRLDIAFNLRVYLSGLAVTTSPGKLGETLRSLLLLPRGVPLSASLAAFFTDRLSDVAGVAAIVVVAAALQGGRAPIFEAIVVAVIAGGWMAAVAVRRRGKEITQTAAARWPRAGRWLSSMIAPARCWASVWTVGRSLACATAAFVAFGLQALVFAAYVQQLDASVPIERSVQIFASATLIGAASMIPAGLGAMEAAAVYQLIDAGMSTADAVAVAIAHRLSTLWFGMVIGVGCLLSLSRLRVDSPSATPLKVGK